MKVRVASTAALGDCTMMSALARALRRKSVQVSLVVPKRFHSLFDGNSDVDELVVDRAEGSCDLLVDLKDCYSSMPHFGRLLSSGERVFPHLVNWMAMSARDTLLKAGIGELDVDRDEVRVFVTGEEIDKAAKRLKSVRARHGVSRTVLFANSALSSNRTVSPALLKRLADCMDDVVFCHLVGPSLAAPAFADAEVMVTPDARELAALAVAADAVIVCDSGPLHVINAGLQSVSRSSDGELSIISPGHGAKVVVVVGSSRSQSVSYADNKCCGGGDVCLVAPCGAHGYAPVELYEKHFNRPFFTRSPTDQSACLYRSYLERGDAPCMNVSIESLLSVVRKALALSS